MNVKEQHIVTGMTTDMSVSKFDATKVVYARNIRITQMEGNQGLLCVTNEKGPLEVSMVDTEGTAFTLGTTIVGSAIIDDQIVLFTHDATSHLDYIYRLDKHSSAPNTFVVTALFAGGNLGFTTTDNPNSTYLETLAVFENEDVKKVYWVDGVHMLRCINIMGGPYSPLDTTQFDSNPVINLAHGMEITKRNDGGEFPAGSIQYAFTYHNQYGPETNVFETSPLYELSSKTKGVSADGRTNCSFLIKLTNTDSNYQYVRAYAIIRTSEYGTPSVRLLGDFANQSDNGVYGISFVDNGIIGSTVDATSLLFIGGEPVAPSTFTVKDNTLFLGNLHLTRPSIGNIPFDTTYATVADKVAALREAGTIPLTNKAGTVDSSVGSGYWFYDYTINNNRPSTKMRHFKSKENYRLGIIAQHETGIWSEVLWLGDYDNNILPEFVGHQTAGIWELTSASGTFTGVLNKLAAAGYKRIAPVVVYPTGSDRKVFCQGLISATVYNVEDRFNNRPFSQASWFFRPISEGFGIAAIPHATLYPAYLNCYDNEGTTVTRITGGAEIEVNSNPRLFMPQAKGYWQGESSEHVLPAEDMVALFGNDYFVDTEIVTLNSPDIDQDDSLQQEDFTGLNLRVVGVAYAGFPSVNVSTYQEITPAVPVTDWGEVSDDIDYSKSRFLSSGTTYGMGTSMAYSGYGISVQAGPNNKNFVPMVLFPWHSAGELMGTPESGHSELNDFVSPKLTHKVLSNLWFARTSFLASSTNVNTFPVKLFDNTQSDFIPLGENADSRVYYGNVDSVRIYKKDLLSSTNVGNIAKNFYVKEPRVLGKDAKLAADTARIPNFSNKMVAWNGPVVAIEGETAVGITGSIDEVLLHYGANRGTILSSYFKKQSPKVPIKYKSTKHAVIQIDKKAGSASGVIPCLYRCEALHTLAGSTVTPFWESYSRTYDTGYVPFITEWATSVNFHKTWTGNRNNYTSYTPEVPTLYIGELYRTVDPSTHFGGNTDKAILSNVWKRCGDAITIASALTGLDSGGARLQYVEGDTYLTRYDCLKTYAYSEEDVNSIVEIFSTDIETRVNLDARYDNARGLLDNTLVNPENINLVNRPGYEQTNQFFTYTTQDYTKETIDDFPASVAITNEKVAGSDVDNWMSIPLTAVQDLDGAYGPIEYLTTFNDEVYAFQHNAFSQVLFNSRVQIPTSDGQPIEITNGMKFGGTRYISNKIGCSNKWSVAHSNSKMYWYDAGSKDLWAFSGQGLENISTAFGVKGWVEQWFGYKWAPNCLYGLRTVHDETYNDLYFIGGNVEANALLFSENLNSFVSFMDYNGVGQLYNIDGKAYALKGSGMYQMWGGSYNRFFGNYKPYILRFIANYQPTMHKVFDTVQWRSDSWNSLGKYLPNLTFSKLQVWNQYQQTAETALTDTAGKPSPLKKKFNTFRALIPRDTQGNSRTNGDYRAKGISRIQGNYAVVQLKHDSEDTHKTQFYDLEIGEFI